MRSTVPEIFHTQTISRRRRQKQNLTHFTACGKYTRNRKYTNNVAVNDRNDQTPYTEENIRHHGDVTRYNLWSRYDLYVLGQRGVLCEVKW